jgi:hypothetical protein
LHRSKSVARQPGARRVRLRTTTPRGGHMGNWRTVRIVGTCNAEDVPALQREITAYLRARNRPVEEWGHIGPLSHGGGICGVPDWAAPRIAAHGNLFERDYTPEDVAHDLEHLATVAPSLAARVHCGGDYEDTACVATVTLVAGEAAVGPPLVEDVGGFEDGELAARTIVAIAKAHQPAPSGAASAGVLHWGRQDGRAEGSA